MCPRRSTSAGFTSSEQNMQRRLFLGVTPLIKVRRFFAADPSRMITFIPRERLSRISSSVEHSWSVVMPAAAVADRASCRIPGAWPSMGRLRFWA